MYSDVNASGFGPIDFTRPMELDCVLDPDAAMRQLWPMCVGLAFVSWLMAALVLGVMFPHVDAVWMVGGALAGVGVPWWQFTRKRKQLRRTYGELQRLILHPGGLRRYDDSIMIDMPWSGIDRFDYRSSALNSLRGRHDLTSGYLDGSIHEANRRITWGIAGQGTITPLPNASQRMLRVHDAKVGSNLSGGQLYSSPNCFIFPSEFEQQWTTGVIGGWLRHYRPDLVLPF